MSRQRDPPLGVGQRRDVEELGDALPPLDFHEQDLPAARRQREGQGPGDRGLAGAPLPGHDVEPHAVPVGVT